MKRNNSLIVDIVLTYVDGNDPIWQKVKNKYESSNKNYKQFRSWDNLQYIFRGIQKNMSFINNIYLVVSNIEQVPAWINQKKVKIILHSDIIPKEYLPTFNSTTIEMFLYRIPGLSEHFIYFNDDLFPLRKLSVNYFFNDKGFPKYKIVKRFRKPQNGFRSQCYNSYILANSLTGNNYLNFEGSIYFYVSHSANPMLKSSFQEVWQKAKDELSFSLSMFREPFNYTQYLFPLYSIMTKKAEFSDGNYSYVHSSNIEEFENALNNKNCKIICFNDNGLNDNIITNNDGTQSILKTFEDHKNYLISKFQKLFPKKSKYEN